MYKRGQSTSTTDFSVQMGSQGESMVMVMLSPIGQDIVLITMTLHLLCFSSQILKYTKGQECSCESKVVIECVLLAFKPGTFLKRFALYPSPISLQGGDRGIALQQITWISGEDMVRTQSM